MVKGQGSRILFALGVSAVAAIHFVVSFFLSFAAGTGGGRVFQVASSILTFPLNNMKGESWPGLLSWLPWISLSLGWGFAVCFLIRLAFNSFK